MEEVVVLYDEEGLWYETKAKLKLSGFEHNVTKVGKDCERKGHRIKLKRQTFRVIEPWKILALILIEFTKKER